MQNKIKTLLLIVTTVALTSVNSVKAIEPTRGIIDSSYSCIDLEKEIKNSTEGIAKLTADLKIAIDSLVSGSISKDKFAADLRDITTKITNTSELLKYYKYLYNRDCNPRETEPIPMPSAIPPSPPLPTIPMNMPIQE